VGRFNKYLGEAEKVEIEYKSGDKEVIMLKPLGWDDIKDMLLLSKTFAINLPEKGEIPIEKMLEKMDSGTIDIMQKIVLKTMKLSYPEEPEDELKAFATKNFMALMPTIIDLNLNTGSTEKLEKIKELQKRVRGNAGKVSPDETVG
jgi:hypothetical protein